MTNLVSRSQHIKSLFNGCGNGNTPSTLSLSIMLFCWTPSRYLNIYGLHLIHFEWGTMLWPHLLWQVALPLSTYRARDVLCDWLRETQGIVTSGWMGQSSIRQQLWFADHTRVMITMIWTQQVNTMVFLRWYKSNIYQNAMVFPSDHLTVLVWR